MDNKWVTTMTLSIGWFHDADLLHSGAKIKKVLTKFTHLVSEASLVCRDRARFASVRKLISPDWDKLAVVRLIFCSMFSIRLPEK